jgi:hypothetical protein
VKSVSGHLGIFTITYFWDVSDLEILKRWRRYLGVHVVKISDVGSLYFQRYALWKLGFLNAPEISFKQVILELSL